MPPEPPVLVPVNAVVGAAPKAGGGGTAVAGAAAVGGFPASAAGAVAPKVSVPPVAGVVLVDFPGAGAGVELPPVIAFGFPSGSPCGAVGPAPKENEAVVPPDAGAVAVFGVAPVSPAPAPAPNEKPPPPPGAGFGAPVVVGAGEGVSVVAVAGADDSPPKENPPPVPAGAGALVPAEGAGVPLPNPPKPPVEAACPVVGAGAADPNDGTPLLPLFVAGVPNEKPPLGAGGPPPPPGAGAGGPPKLNAMLCHLVCFRLCVYPREITESHNQLLSSSLPLFLSSSLPLFLSSSLSHTHAPYLSLAMLFLLRFSVVNVLIVLAVVVLVRACCFCGWHPRLRRISIGGGKNCSIPIPVV